MVSLRCHPPFELADRIVRQTTLRLAAAKIALYAHDVRRLYVHDLHGRRVERRRDTLNGKKAPAEIPPNLRYRRPWYPVTPTQSSPAA